MVTGEGATLSEHPDVRVRAAAVNMFFVREAEGRVAGRLFFGSCLWSEQRNERNVFEFFWIPAFAGMTRENRGQAKYVFFAACEKPFTAPSGYPQDCEAAGDRGPECPCPQHRHRPWLRDSQCRGRAWCKLCSGSREGHPGRSVSQRLIQQ